MIDWLACVIAKSLSQLACWMSPGAAVWVGERLGSLAYWVQPKRRRIGLNNVRAAFDGRYTLAQADRIVRAYFRNLGAGLMELLRLPAMDRAYLERYISIEGFHHIEQAVASGRPVMLLTGHYGNWELCSIAAALKGRPIMALARAQRNMPRLYQLLVSYRESKGCRVIHKGGAMRHMIAALSRGELVGIVGDQVSRQGIFVNFFGRPALFATGPFAMAHKTHALIIPAFIHRIRGPSHRILIGPPIELPHSASEEEAVHLGLKLFAKTLTHHIEDDPTQWLWLHKKWKYTPARKLVVLSDGKLGHVKQSLATVQMVSDQQPHITHEVVEIRYRHRVARGLALAWSWILPRWGMARCLQWTLTPASWEALSTRYADLVMSCGASLTPVNILWSRQQRAKSIVLLNPAPFPLSRFDLVIAPRHDRLPSRSNVVKVTGAVATRLDAQQLSEASERLHHHPRFSSLAASRGPRVALFLGGDTQVYHLSESFVDGLIQGILGVVQEHGGEILVTSSRRTSAAVEHVLIERLAREPRCRLLLLASRDALNGTLEGMLGDCHVAVVTGESISMVSEACASGRPVIVVQPPSWNGRPKHQTKHHRFLHALVQEECIALVPVHDVATALHQALHDPPMTSSGESLAPIRNALAKLI